MEREVSEVERKRLVKKKYLEKISSILSMGVINQQLLYSTVRGFFSELLKLEYEFTYEELSLELNKVFLKPVLKKEIDDFLLDLSESEYFLERDLEQDKVRELFLQINKIVQSMSYDAEISERKPSFFEKIFGGKNRVSDNALVSPVESSNILVTSGVDKTLSTNANSDSNKLSNLSVAPMVDSKIGTAPLSVSKMNVESMLINNRLGNNVLPNISDNDSEDVNEKNQLFKQELIKGEGMVMGSDVNNGYSAQNLAPKIDSEVDASNKIFGKMGEDLSDTNSAVGNKKGGLDNNMLFTAGIADINNMIKGSDTVANNNNNKRVSNPQTVDNKNTVDARKKTVVSKKFSKQKAVINKNDIDDDLVNTNSSSNDLFNTNNANTLSTNSANSNTSNTIRKDVLIENNTPAIVALHELMEESYLHVFELKKIDAKKCYLKALNIYHTISESDKLQVYPELYALFTKLKSL